MRLFTCHETDRTWVNPREFAQGVVFDDGSVSVRYLIAKNGKLVSKSHHTEGYGDYQEFLAHRFPVPLVAINISDSIPLVPRSSSVEPGEKKSNIILMR